MAETNLQGKVVLVGGASGKLGQLIIERLVREGTRIAAFVRSEEAARQIEFPASTDGAVFTVDLIDEASVVACFKEVHARFGPPDAYIHAVGTWEASPLIDTSLEEWQAVMDTNLTSAFLCFREAVHHMLGRRGQLIAFAAAAGADRGIARQAAYSASKAGVVRLVEAVSAEFGVSGIDAYAIAPSTIVYGGDSHKGVHASELVDLAIYLLKQAGESLNGATLRAYGVIR